ncbi:MAG: hypothetical protein ABIK27_02525, partial [Bacteroidota bacterium]
MRVYLSGGMEYADGEGIHWRQDLQNWIEKKLNHECFNPNVESNIFFDKHYPSVNFRELKMQDIDLYKSIATKLVEIDSKEIAERTDYLICYWDNGAAKGAGTKGELTMAKYFGKPVYLVTSYSHS